VAITVIPAWYLWIVPVIQPPQSRRSGGELAGFLDRLPQLWRLPSSYSREAFVILLVLAACAGTALIGAVHTRKNPHDIFVLLASYCR